ncbi:hypothetical protein LINPERPRIM_LOCUS20447, partial [Linum perenne]
PTHFPTKKTPSIFTKLVFHHQSTLTLKFFLFFINRTLGRRRKSQTSFDHEFALNFKVPHSIANPRMPKQLGEFRRWYNPKRPFPRPRPPPYKFTDLEAKARYKALFHLESLMGVYLDLKNLDVG